MNIIDRCIFQELRENQFIMLEKRMTDESTFYIFHFIGIGKKGRGARKDGTKIFGYLMNDFFFFFFFWVAFCQRRGTRSGALVLEFGEDVTGASWADTERRGEDWKRGESLDFDFVWSGYEMHGWNFSVPELWIVVGVQMLSAEHFVYIGIVGIYSQLASII